MAPSGTQAHICSSHAYFLQSFQKHTCSFCKKKDQINDEKRKKETKSMIAKRQKGKGIRRANGIGEKDCHED
jgi:hypothetical protein